jgi:hypothetical protein
VAQGGFCPREIVLYLNGNEHERFEGKDINAEQFFDLSLHITGQAFETVKLEFISSSDFYGRVLLYSLELLVDK